MLQRANFKKEGIFIFMLLHVLKIIRQRGKLKTKCILEKNTKYLLTAEATRIEWIFW